MSGVQGPLFTKPRRRFIRLWAALALLNLATGVAGALQPERWTDLESVMRWGHQWLIEGANVYAAPDTFVPYPPHGVVLLSPLGVLPFAAVFPLWVMFNLALSFLAPYFAARFFQPHAPFRTILLPVLMFGSWWGTHTLVQFSLLALALSMAALMWADDKPGWSGVSLGLALMKPQVAIPVLCWALFTRRWKIAASAIAVVGAGCALFCVRAHAGPVDVVKPLIRAAALDVPRMGALPSAIAFGLFAGICVAGFQEGRSRRLLYAAPPLVACWSLLTFDHLSYGLVVLLPVMMLLVFNDTERTPLRRYLFWLLQIGMMIEMPDLARRAGFSLPHADSVLILAMFIGLVTLAWRESAPA